MNRGDLTNEQWERLQPLLPPEKLITGRPALSHRQVLNGILWVLRTGAFTYTPPVGCTGPVTFTYQASDGQLLSLPAPVRITVVKLELFLPLIRR